MGLVTLKIIAEVGLVTFKIIAEMGLVTFKLNAEVGLVTFKLNAEVGLVTFKIIAEVGLVTFKLTLRWVWLEDTNRSRSGSLDLVTFKLDHEKSYSVWRLSFYISMF